MNATCIYTLGIPQNWDIICGETNLPRDFSVWYYFFQELITERAVHLISKKVKSNIELLQNDIVNLLEETAKSEKSEEDLRWYTWYEHTEDVSRVENVHTGKTSIFFVPKCFQMHV